MSDFAWFKLLVRTVGVLLIGLGIPSLMYDIGTVVMMAIQFAPGGGPQPFYLIGLVGAGFQVGLGLYLLFGGQWIMRRCLREVQGRCIACGYDLEGISLDVCPECGSALPENAKRSLQAKIQGTKSEP